jgi:ABC-type polysaccharide/polyol phosphate export permease
VEAHDWIENRATAGRRATRVGEVWPYRELVLFLATRDVRVRYKQAVFGVAWAVIQPLAGAAVLSVVFHRYADVEGVGASYELFAFAGFAVWTYFSTALGTVTQSLVGNSGLITKVYFPRIVAPLAGLLPALVDLGIAMSVLVAALVITGDAPGLAVLATPLWLLALMAAALGPGLILATLNVKYRDAHQAFGLLTQLWLFASPVAYSSNLVPDGWRYAFALNPMSGVIEGFRWSFLGEPPPDRTLLVSLAVAAALLLGGVRYFRSAERRFADVI